MIRRVSRGAIALFAIALAHPANAHEYWLAPSRYRSAEGDTIAVTAWAGTGFRGEPKAYARSRVKRFERFDPEPTDLAKFASDGDTMWVRLIARGTGGTLIAYESGFSTIELPAHEFDEYLEAEGLDRPLQARRALGAKVGPGRERYARCAKTWIGGENPEAAMLPRGLTLEVVPVRDPSLLDTLDVRVLFLGKPLAGALVRAWNQPLADGFRSKEVASRDSVGPIAQARTNPAGIASLGRTQVGEWMLSVVHMVPSADPDAAEWDSYWASFSFAAGGSP